MPMLVAVSFQGLASANNIGKDYRRQRLLYPPVIVKLAICSEGDEQFNGSCPLICTSVGFGSMIHPTTRKTTLRRSGDLMLRLPYGQKHNLIFGP